MAHLSIVQSLGLIPSGQWPGGKSHAKINGTGSPCSDHRDGS